MKPELEELIRKAKAKVAAMTPEEYAAMLEEQSKSWARGMAPCEHGFHDFEDCPDCRAKARSGE